MILYRYELTESRGAEAIPYGILGKQEEDGHWRSVAVVAPFSKNREAVIRLAEECTALQICPWQLMDIVVDFISDGRN